MTCKDCIHEQCCKIWEPNEKYFEKADENNCAAFKNKADYAEVKHGKWIDDGDCFHCSACNKTYQLGSLQTIYDVRRCWSYCANCGSKMDGGKE